MPSRKASPKESNRPTSSKKFKSNHDDERVPANDNICFLFWVIVERHRTIDSNPATLGATLSFVFARGLSDTQYTVLNT